MIHDYAAPGVSTSENVLGKQEYESRKAYFQTMQKAGNDTKYVCRGRSSHMRVATTNNIGFD